MPNLAVILRDIAVLILTPINAWFKVRTKPSTERLALGTAFDLTCSKSELMVENAMLRQQLIVLNRLVNRCGRQKTDPISNDDTIE